MCIRMAVSWAVGIHCLEHSLSITSVALEGDAEMVLHVKFGKWGTVAACRSPESSGEHHGIMRKLFIVEI